MSEEEKEEELSAHNIEDLSTTKEKLLEATERIKGNRGSVDIPSLYRTLAEVHGVISTLRLGYYSNKLTKREKNHLINAYEAILNFIQEKQHKNCPTSIPVGRARFKLKEKTYFI